MLIGAASLAGRRWGPAVSGWLVGLPFTSAPIAFFLAREEGSSFAATAAAGTMAGAVSQAGFCVAYAWTATRARWPSALVAGSAAFSVSTVALQRLPFGLAMLALVAAAGMTIAVAAMPASSAVARVATPLPWWDLPLRMVVATAFVVGLTALAARLGARLTGLLAPFPLYAAILTVFAHTMHGAAAATAVLRGLVLGLFAFAAFFFVLATLLPTAGMAVGFSAAVVTALVAQGISLAALTRRRARTARI